MRTINQVENIKFFLLLDINQRMFYALANLINGGLSLKDLTS